MNHLSKWVSLSLCSFSIWSAHALLGEYISRENIPDAVCSVDIFDMSEKGEGSCTGTLIGPRHVLTAAHCVGGLGDLPTLYSVTCGKGSNAISVVGRSEVYHQEFKETEQAPEPTTFDLGVITLDEDITDIPVMEVSESQEQTEAILAYSQVSCIAYGQGYDNFGYSGKMNGVQVKMMPGLVTMKKKVLIPTPIPGVNVLAIKTYDNLVVYDPNFSNPLRPGDSGGPLVCRGKEGRDIVVGVHSMGFGGMNIDVDPGANFEWIQQQMY